jgi:hypothetical protein
MEQHHAWQAKDDIQHPHSREIRLMKHMKQQNINYLWQMNS